MNTYVDDKHYGNTEWKKIAVASKMQCCQNTSF